MISTRKFTEEEQRILEDFIKSDKIFDLVNDKIHDKEKCRKWVNENLKIKDKFLWMLSDIREFRIPCISV